MSQPTNREFTMIVTYDGRVFSGRTAAAIIKRMLQAGLFTAAKTLPEYMRGVSARALALDGATVRHDTPDNFLTDLAACGTIEITPTA